MLHGSSTDNTHCGESDPLMVSYCLTNNKSISNKWMNCEWVDSHWTESTLIWIMTPLSSNSKLWVFDQILHHWLSYYSPYYCETVRTVWRASRNKADSSLVLKHSLMFIQLCVDSLRGIKAAQWTNYFINCWLINPSTVTGRIWWSTLVCILMSWFAYEQWFSLNGDSLMSAELIGIILLHN